MDLNKRIDLRLGSGGSIRLLPSDFITSGGEGAIYRKGSTVYKVYIDGKNHDEMEEKVKLLQVFGHGGSYKGGLIVTPIDVLFDSKGSIAGYTMSAVEGEPLVKYFSNDFRLKMKFGLPKTVEVVQEMQAIVSVAHYNHALIIDGNEMNYILHGKTPYIIDVDSWQIGKFKATAIMMSIRDFLSQEFSELTDWYSWGIVTFQLFTGIHPFKGRHPDYKPGELERRMRDMISVYHPKTQLPAAARDFDDIPKQLADWYRTIFTSDFRATPPGHYDTVQPTKIKTRIAITSSGKIKFDKIKEVTSPVVKVFPTGQILTAAELIGKTTWDSIVGEVGPFTEVTPCENGLLVTTNWSPPTLEFLENGKSRKDVSPSIARTRIIRSDTRLFAIHNSGMTEIKTMKLGSNLVCSTGNTWNFEPRSTFIGEGVLVYDALGAKYVILPFKDNACLVVRCPELDKYKMLGARAFSNFVTCLVKDSRGQNFKFEILYTDDGRVVNLWSGATDENDINAAMNSRGIMATIVEDGKLILFSPENGKKTVVDNKHIKTDMRLWNMHGNIVFSRDNELWSISLS